MKDAGRGKYSIGAVENAFSVLEFIIKHQADVSAIEIHARTGIPKATLHKLLQTLKDLDYIGQNPETNQYFATLKPLQMGYYCLNRRQFLSTYYPYVLMYLRKFGYPLSLTCYSGYDAVVVYSSVGSANLVVDSKLYAGRTSPVYASSTGRLLLSTLDDETVRSILESIPLIPFTNRTPCEVDEIIQSLEQVRRQGYCRLDGELYFGFSSYSFPLRDRQGDLIGSLNLIFPENQADAALTPAAASDILKTLDKVRLNGG